MKNKESIDKINAFVDSVNQERKNMNDLVKFDIQDVKFDGALRVGDYELHEVAQNAVLGKLNAKPTFSEFQSIMEPEDWKIVSQKIKNAKADLSLFGVIALDESGNQVIRNVYTKNPKKETEDITQANHLIELLTEKLSLAPEGWAVSTMDFDPERSVYSFGLLNKEQDIEALPGDIWHGGQLFNISSAQTKQKSFYERQVCANGMTSEVSGFSSWIDRASFNTTKIGKIFENALSFDDGTLESKIQKYAKHAKANTISLREFYEYRNFLDKRGYDDLLAKYFNEAPFYKAWGESITDKPKQWLATANTGINAYDFINLITWIASHKESGVTGDNAQALKNSIINLFTKQYYDTEMSAPSVKVDFPHYSEME